MYLGRLTHKRGRCLLWCDRLMHRNEIVRLPGVLLQVWLPRGEGDGLHRGNVLRYHVPVNDSNVGMAYGMCG